MAERELLHPRDGIERALDRLSPEPFDLLGFGLVGRLTLELGNPARAPTAAATQPLDEGAD